MILPHDETQITLALFLYLQRNTLQHQHSGLFHQIQKHFNVCQFSAFVFNVSVSKFIRQCWHSQLSLAMNVFTRWLVWPLKGILASRVISSRFCFSASSNQNWNWTPKMKQFVCLKWASTLDKTLSYPFSSFQAHCWFKC